MVAIATAAAVIASQALISGAFSLTRQAIQLGYFPRLDVEHTSTTRSGQIYVPQINWMLAISTILIVIGFRSSGALAAAYGIAVTMTMVITGDSAAHRRDRTVEVAAAGRLAMTAPSCPSTSRSSARTSSRFPRADGCRSSIGVALFTRHDHVEDGPPHRGRATDRARDPARGLLRRDYREPAAPRRGTAVFMTAQPRGTPPALAHNLRYNKILHEHVSC